MRTLVWRVRIRVEDAAVWLFDHKRWQDMRNLCGLWMDAEESVIDWIGWQMDAEGEDLWRFNYLRALSDRVAKQGKIAYLATYHNEKDAADAAWAKMVRASQRGLELMAEIDMEPYPFFDFCASVDLTS